MEISFHWAQSAPNRDLHVAEKLDLHLLERAPGILSRISRL